MQDPIKRNVQESIGVFLPLDLSSKSPAEGLFQSSVPIRAFEQALDIAARAGDKNAEAELFAQAEERWGKTAAFSSSPIVRRCSKTLEEPPHD